MKNQNLQPTIYKTINVICRERVSSKKFPYIATEREIKDEMSRLVSDALTEMVEDGVIKCSQNINGIRMFAPTNSRDLDSNDIL